MYITLYFDNKIVYLKISRSQNATHFPSVCFFWFYIQMMQINWFILHFISLTDNPNTTQSSVFKHPSSGLKAANKQSSLPDYCDICCMTRDNADIEMCALDDCLHYFCIDCWRQHFESLVNFGAYLSSTFECMQTKCGSVASKEFVLKCLNHSNELPETPTLLNSNSNSGLGNSKSLFYLNDTLTIRIS